MLVYNVYFLIKNLAQTLLCWNFGVGKDLEKIRMMMTTLDRYFSRYQTDRGSIYHRSYNRWIKPGLTKNTIPLWAYWLLFALCLFSLILMGFTWFLRRTVKIKTHELVQNHEKLRHNLEVLQQSKDDLKESQRIAHLGSWRLDLATDQVVWTEELYKMYGFDPTIPPPPHTEHMKLFTPESWKKLSTSLANTRETGLPYELELETVREDKKSGWIWVRGEAVIGERGETIGLQGAAQDITDRKHVEDALRESRQKFHSMVDNIGIGVTLISLNLEILEMNKKMREWYPQISIEHRPTCYQVFNNPPRENMCNYCPTIKTIQDGKVHEGITSTPCAGSVRNFRIVSSPIFDSHGELTAVIEMVEDTTDRLRLETQLRQSQRIESIGTLAGGIAHDFNNILSSILGFTELALDGAEKGTELEDYLQEVCIAGLRAKDLVKQILTFARQSDEAVKPIHVKNVAKEVLRFIKSSIPTTIQITKKIESDSFIMGSSTQLHQVLMNLCTNAAQAMEEKGGFLEVSMNDTTIDKMSMIPDLRPGEYIKIKVTDTGIGISQKHIHNIFEPYFTTKTVGKGTGMGLAVIHGIVENYGGQIAVDSTIGKGSCFTIYLPITKKRNIHTHFEEDSLPLGNENILFVDDEAPIAKMGRKALERLGYAVTARTSSVEALELFKSKPQTFDLVISDMTMPNLTGDKLAIELMKVRADIPVILCTGYSNKISEETVSEIGIKAFIYKPVVKSDLAKTVREVLDETKRSS